MKITIFWTWYVWLVTWACLAEVGHKVLCVDIDENKIDKLKTGIIPIYERWLEELVLRNHKEWRLLFSTDAKAWVEFWQAIFNSVWTPPDENNKAELKYIKTVAKTFWKYLWENYKVFINKSTVPVWTWELCKKIIIGELNKKSAKWNFDVVSNPEFLKEWIAIRDFMLPDRIVCWVDSDNAKKIMEDIYKPFTRYNSPKIFFTDIKSSEIIKYAANSFLATKISFINEVANFCELAWWNILDISKWIGLDKRIWEKFLHAWIWYGWSCFPKDIDALIQTWKDYNYDFKIINSVQEVNKNQKIKVVDKLLKKLNLEDKIDWNYKKSEWELLRWKNISIWWISFKPKTDDIREAPSIDIIKKLIELWVGKINCFDPVAIKNLKTIFKNQRNVYFFDSKYDSLIKSDALILLTEWDEFRVVDFDKIKKIMSWNIIIDWRNIWNKEEMKNLWFDYEWIWI